jgi:predicted metal-dependent phosphoesterase TrpH
LKLKIDLHVHSYYSADSLITPQELVFYAKKRGLDGVAVTDHDRFDGALKIADQTELLIVPGMEIMSLDGHIVALNVRESIPSGLSPDDAVDKIHAAGGIAIACHPTGLFKGGLGKHTSSKLDAVEVINSSAIPFAYSVRQNEQIASRLGKPRVAGSDAHYGPEIGLAYAAIEAELNVDAVITAISKGLCQPFGRSIPLRMRLRKMIESYKRRLHS